MQLSHASDVKILQESNRVLKEELRALKSANNKLKKVHEVRIKVEEELQMEMQAVKTGVPANSLQLAGSSSAPQGNRKRKEPTQRDGISGKEKLSINSFKFIRVLGQEGFGKVVLAKKKLPGGPEQLYAIKAVEKKGLTTLSRFRQAMVEKDAMRLASGHPYIVTLHSFFQNKRHLFFVMDYLSEGGLRQQLKQAGIFSKTRTQFYAAEITVALQH
jgi:serine/threonine protein kinase